MMERTTESARKNSKRNNKKNAEKNDRKELEIWIGQIVICVRVSAVQTERAD